ncbi:hypothetical protein BJ875DRAFT_517365 [Amylocarpus encephaloides]|uniref:Uncharacterized protein n=1 Tax=Amylocarpus encephaloides TaxID=45428 RepID=A0A9P8C8X3_9HELO|nr:hypothetical protein BJ875DRAFT_517365 [Amylocarpus encephaloides]
MGSWFATEKAPREGWRLDIVSLLAVVGEGSMEAHMQPMTSSWTCMLPRIMPAPQALLNSSPPTRMPQVPASVVGVTNGTLVDSLNFFPNIIHPIDDLPAFAFKLYEIKHKANVVPQELPVFSKEKISVGEKEAQQLGLQGSETTIRHIQKAVTQVLLDGTPHITTQALSPLNLLSILSCLLTIGLFIWAALITDGTACLALSPVLKKRVFNGTVPEGDVVIRTREGAFVVVKCNEEVARELYTGTEECTYFATTGTFRILVDFGTFLLMCSVVLLRNCDFAMQAGIGGSYIILNGAFWLVSLVSKDRFWDLSIYDVKEITPQDALGADQNDEKYSGNKEGLASYTRTMWYAIRETRKTAWVKRSGATPSNTEWEEWLREAEEMAYQTDGDIIGREKSSPTPSRVHRSSSDPAEQAAPALQVPPPEKR